MGDYGCAVFIVESSNPKNLGNTLQDLYPLNTSVNVLSNKHENRSNLAQYEDHKSDKKNGKELEQEDNLPHGLPLTFTEKLENSSVSLKKDGFDLEYIDEKEKCRVEENIEVDVSAISLAAEVPVEETDDDAYQEYASGLVHPWNKVRLSVPSSTALKDRHGNYPSAVNIWSSLASHWLPSAHCNNSSNFSDLSSFPSLKSHYVRLPKPGESFTSLEHLNQEFRELLRAKRAGRQDCRQS